MIDYGKELVSALETILPTHYEMTLTSKTETPCISWMEIGVVPTSDPTGENTNLASYRLNYSIKIWGNRLEELNNYAVEIARALRPLGFKVGTSGELYDHNSTMIQKILNAEATALVEL
jgi:hypothetical protein